MTEVKRKILIVDDDKFAQKLIVRALGAKYDLKTADDGIDAIALAKKFMPETILLDVEMPGKNGYEVCEALKSDPTTARIPIIFLSANGTMREKMLGFELGAEDYLVKPFVSDLLNAKVKHAIESYLELIELDKKASHAQTTAFEALTTSAELGRALRFVEHTYSIPTFEALAGALFHSMNEAGLNCSVMFLTLQGPLFYSQLTSTVPPLEQDLLLATHAQGRFIDFGCRTFINFRQVALLIKNMPLEDRERYGRIKDTVPFILGAVDGKIRSLDIHQALLQQEVSLKQSVDSISTTLSSLVKKVNDGQTAFSDTMQALMMDLDAQMPKLGLEDDQEKFLVTRIDSAFQNALEELNRTLLLGNSLSSVVRLLTHLQEQHDKIIQSTLVEPEQADSYLPNDGAVLSSDVELF
jgi:DNA-binding response OmpR family regulator